MLRRLKLKGRQGGFTLIELLIVVAIIGIIAALLIPNFLDSLQKAKQKRTVADMRGIGTAMMSWLTDEAGAASAGFTVAFTSWESDLTYADARSILTPQYIQELPEKDGWKNNFTYGMDTDNPMADRVLAIHSGGRDFTTGGGTWPPAGPVPAQSGPYEPSSYDNDILWADGYFLIWPEKPTQ